MISQEILKVVDPFDRPIPGQSLTNSVDNPYPWEGPPEFTKVDEAIDAIVTNLLTEEGKLLSVIEVIFSSPKLLVYCTEYVAFPALLLILLLIEIGVVFKV